MYIRYSIIANQHNTSVVYTTLWTSDDNLRLLLQQIHINSMMCLYQPSILNNPKKYILLNIYMLCFC